MDAQQVCQVASRSASTKASGKAAFWRIEERRRELELAESFLGHVLECVHPVVTECPACTDFVAAAAVARPGDHRS